MTGLKSNMKKIKLLMFK